MLFENIHCVSCILQFPLPHANGNSQWSQQGSQHLSQWAHLGYSIIRWLLYNFCGDDSNEGLIDTVHFHGWVLWPVNVCQHLSSHSK